MLDLLKLLKPKKPRHSPAARLLHWIYAPAVLAALWSGFYITKPSEKLGFKSMNSARKTHFIAQYILMGSYIGTLYHLWVTKRFGEIIPKTKDAKDMPRFMKYQLFLTKRKPKFPKYNPAQKTLFTGLGLLIPFQAVTGMVLYAAERFQKTVALAGGLNPLRHLHYLAALVTTSMVAGHLYFALSDNLKKFKSIFTGYK